MAIISFCIAPNENSLAINNQKNPKNASTSHLIYGDFRYDKFNASPFDNIIWAFSSSDVNVEITVMAMNSGNFSFFNNSQSYIYISLSPGSLPNDSGTFSPNYIDTWYIVYLNNDTIMQSTILDYNTTLEILAPNITITSPDISSYWTMGSHYYIKWDSTGNISNVNIELFNDGKYSYTIGLNVENNGSHLWILPLFLNPSYSYQIKIIDTYNSSNYYFSNEFSILTKVSFEITKPNSQSSWEPGSTYHIYWKTVGSIPRVSIFLYKNGIYYLTIITSIGNVGSYFWTLPSNLPASDQYKIKIMGDSNLNIYTYSDNFYIAGHSATQSNKNTSIVIILVFLFLLPCIYLGVRFQKSRKLNQSKMLDKTHISLKESDKSLYNQQNFQFERQPINKQLKFGQNTSELPNICPNCGVLISIEKIFCTECGYRLVRDY